MGEERTQLAKTHRVEPEKLHRHVEPDLDWIVMKAIEKDRTRRYETANAFAQDIVRFLADEPVTATPPSAGYQLRKFSRRNKAALRVAAAIAAVLVAATLVSTWQAVRATAAERKTAETLAEVAAERDAKELARGDAEDISEFLGEVFQSPDPTRDGREIKVVELLDQAAQKLETGLADQPAQRAKLQATLGDTYHALGLARQAIPLLEKAKDHYLAASGPEHPDTLGAMHGLAAAYHAVGRRDEARNLTEEMLTLTRKVNGPEHPDTLGAMTNLAISYNNAGRLVEGIALQEESLTIKRRVLPRSHPFLPVALDHLADLYEKAGLKDEALKLRDELAALRQENSDGR